MPVSRRIFIASAQTLLAAAALPMKFFGAASNLGLPPEANLLTATKATFQPLVNSSFTVGGSGPLTRNWLTLLSVEEMSSAQPAKPTTASASKTRATAPTVVDTFALRFYGTGESLPQGTYELENRKLGTFSLFIVPSGPSTYTAIISHVQSGASIPAPKRTVGAPIKAGNL